MIWHRLWLYLLPVLLVACAPLGKEQPLTLKDLEKEPLALEARTPTEVSRDRVLAQYRAFLEASPSSPLRAEAMRRLADLQLEAGAGLGPGEAVPGIPVGQAAAIALYLELLDKFPRRAGNDRVLYQLAKAYEENGEPDKALATLDRLIEAYPATAYRNEVQFRRAEMLFVRRRYEEAARAYEDVLSDGGGTPFFEQALYKRGWSLFKQEQYDAALDAFFAILDRKLASYLDGNGAIALDDLGRADHELVQDTLRVSSLSFSYLRGAGSIREYLARGERRHYAYLAYDSLGRLYLDKERFNDAALTYHAFAEHYPQHGQAPLLQMQAIAAYRKGAFPSLVLKEKLDFATRYGLDAPFWRRHRTSDLPQVTAYLKDTVDELAKYYHAVAQRTGDAAAYGQAVQWYERYLAYFPTDEAAPGMNFLLAEALYESGRYREAAVQYERTAYDYAGHAKGAEAGYAAVLAYEKYHDGLPDGAQRLLWQRRALAGALRFADRYPRHPQAGAALAKAATGYFKLRDREPAGVVAQRLLQEHPTAQPAQRLAAWKVIAYLAFDNREFARAEQAYAQVLALMPARDPARDDMVESLAASIYKQGEQRRAAGDLEGAARHFLRVSQAAPGASILAVAEYDGAAALLALEDWARAIPVLNGFRKRYPGHELQGDVTTKLAVAYLESGQPVKAASEFERIGGSSGDPAIRSEALWRAAEMYEQASLASKAAATYKQYIEAFPAKFDESMEARHRLARLNEQVGNTRRHRYWLKQIIAADKAAGGRRTERSRYLAANAALVLAAPAYEAFAGVRLVAPLDKNLKLKKRRMEAALDAYRQAADYGIAEVTTAATFRIAEIYHGLSEGLLESQRPKGLTEEELEEYDILLEEQAYPFEEQAIAIHEINVQRVTEGIYDEWVNASFEKLAALLPVRYAKPEKSEKIVEVIY